LVILGAFNTAASGQPIDLVCRETEYNEYNKVKGPSEAAVVDLERRRISTPVGDFQISSVSDTMVVFEGDDPQNKKLKVQGFVHRLTGEIDIFWSLPEQSPHKGCFIVASYANGSFEIACGPAASHEETVTNGSIGTKKRAIWPFSRVSAVAIWPASR
jgi:hypothetical protein